MNILSLFSGTVDNTSLPIFLVSENWEKSETIITFNKQSSQTSCKFFIRGLWFDSPLLSSSLHELMNECSHKEFEIVHEFNLIY